MLAYLASDRRRRLPIFLIEIWPIKSHLQRVRGDRSSLQLLQLGVHVAVVGHLEVTNLPYHIHR